MVSTALLFLFASVVATSAECPEGSFPGDLGQKCYKLAGSHNTLSDSTSACKDLSTDDHRFSLLHPADTSDSFSALDEIISVWRMQGKPDGVCWMDSDGKEIENVDPVDVYPEDDAFPTLVADKERDAINQVSSNETYPYICQFDVPSEGCSDIGNVLQEDDLCFRFQLIPSTYDEALADCSGRNESLIAPENMASALELLNGADFTKARLNAVANETCFLGPDGERLYLEDLFGEEFAMDIPTAPTSGFVLAVENGKGQPIVLQEDEMLTTICVLDDEGGNSGGGSSENTCTGIDRERTLPICEQPTLRVLSDEFCPSPSFRSATEPSLPEQDIQLDRDSCLLLRVRESSSEYCAQLFSVSNSLPDPENWNLEVSLLGLPLDPIIFEKDQGIILYSPDTFAFFKMDNKPGDIYDKTLGCTDRLNLAMPAGSRVNILVQRPAVDVDVVVKLVEKESRNSLLPCSKDRSADPFVVKDHIDPATGCAQISSPGYPISPYYGNTSCFWNLKPSSADMVIQLDMEYFDLAPFDLLALNAVLDNPTGTTLFELPGTSSTQGSKAIPPFEGSVTSPSDARVNIVFYASTTGYGWGFKICAKEVPAE